MKEIIWKPIKGYEDLYEIDNCGVVRNKRTLRLLKLCVSKKGYICVGLHKNGVEKKFKIHRLVAEAFIKNPLNKKEVNHIDENKQNNNVDNLEFVTRRENVNHSHIIERLANKNSKPILQFSLDDEFIKQWKSASEVGRTLNIDPSCIIKVCRGKRKQCCGYKWRYANKKEGV